MRPRAGEENLVVRVLPDVVGIDKEFDYTATGVAADRVEVGTQVRIALGSRRVGGWVVAVGVPPVEGVRLRPVSKVRGVGPEPALIELAEWAAWRWAGRRAHFLRTASPPAAVPELPCGRSRRASIRPDRDGDWPSENRTVTVAQVVDDALAAGGDHQPGGGSSVVVRLPPAADLTPAVVAAAGRGPALVIVPTQARASVLAERLSRRGVEVAELPRDCARARAGCDVVVGTRAAAWGPCAGLAVVMVVDAHDEGLAQEAAPTWNAAVVAAERARRAGVPCLLVSPCPTLELLAAGPVITSSRALERGGWAPPEILDRRQDDPRLGLWSERLVRAARQGDRVAVILNRRGRGRLLACGACGALARCERCGGAVSQSDDDVATSTRSDQPRPLACQRCGLRRPPVCVRCGSTRLKLLRVGVTRAREELEALLGRPVVEVSGKPSGATPLSQTGAPAPADDAPGGLPTGAAVTVGTEAVLHRAGALDVVAFADFDQELLAPRFRASEEALAHLARASRLVGGRRRGGRVLVQTRVPDHPVLGAALRADPTWGQEAEAQVRSVLALPPATAMAAVSGDAAEGWVSGLTGVEVLGPDRGRWVVKAADHGALADALASRSRPPAGLRVEVDPRR